MKMKSVVCIILFLFSTSLAAKTIYVSSTGNDTNEGTKDRPVLTLHQARAICTSSPDASFTILLKGGDTFTEHIATDSDVVEKGKGFGLNS